MFRHILSDCIFNYEPVEQSLLIHDSKYFLFFFPVLCKQKSLYFHVIWRILCISSLLWLVSMTTVSGISHADSELEPHV